MIRNEERVNQNAYVNDRGSTLITVIVAIAFVTILTSIILGSSVVNVRMKGIDRHTKDDFYYAEKALNDIYAGLGMELSEKAGGAYEEAFEKVGEVGADVEGKPLDYNVAADAEKEFRYNFLLAAKSFLDGLDSAKLKNYIYPTDPDARTESVIYIKSTDSVEYQTKNGTHCDGPSDSKAYRVVMKGVTVSVKDSNNIISSITTDIVVTVPSVDFLGANADISDYGIIANEGLYIEGNSTITGNVYAGVHSEIDSDYSEVTDEYLRDNYGGGINIKNGTASFNGNYIVSKGDITLAGNNPGISVRAVSDEDMKVFFADESEEGDEDDVIDDDSNRANLWFTSLRTLSSANISAPTPTPSPTPSPTPTPVKPCIDLNANVFALNDLTLNADNSSVKIEGNYYGYNDKTIKSKMDDDTSKPFWMKSGRDDGESSAIIINGSNVSLDMTDINNFVLMGKAYIDFTSDDDTDEDNTITQVVPTAEGLALKTNQQLYLVPTDFLDGPNPALDDNSVGFSITDSDIKNWFGLKYLEYGDNIDSPDLSKIHTKYTVTLESGEKLYYDYLNFDDKKSWKPVKDFSGQIIGYEPNVKNNDPALIDDPNNYYSIGTEGAISSKAAFFYEIMKARESYRPGFNTAYPSPSEDDPTLDEYIETKEAELSSTILQPSAYRLWARINGSMGYEYFNLKKCVIGSEAPVNNAHYYAKNAVINYKRSESEPNVFQSNVFDNTVGMARYMSYPQNLFWRYVYLCTQLNGMEQKLLDESFLESERPDMSEWKVVYDTEHGAKPAPIGHFVILDNVSMDITDPDADVVKAVISNSINAAKAPKVGLVPSAFGVVVAAEGNLDLGDIPDAALTSGEFRGVAIVKGNITVPSGMNVRGLLISTGTITIKGGGSKITYDKGLIQSRIEKEMSIVRNSSETKADAYNKSYLLINYLSKFDGTHWLYDVEPGSKIKRDSIDSDYSEFMFYENWTKGLTE